MDLGNCLLLFVFVFCLCCESAGRPAAHSDRELFAQVLFTFVGRACDGESIRLRCPHTATINVQTAEYGRRADERSPCPPDSTWIRRSFTPADDDTWTPDDMEYATQTCLAANAAQTVMSACEGKRHCHITVRRNFFIGNSSRDCLTSPSYVTNQLTVAYQCRPSELLSRSVCHGHLVQLNCPRAQRLAIYSATFTKLVGGPCAQLEANTSTSSFFADCEEREQVWSHCPGVLVTRQCHGRQGCQVVANRSHGGWCQWKTSSSALRIVFACVVPRILRQTLSDWLLTESASCRTAAGEVRDADLVLPATVSSVNSLQTSTAPADGLDNSSTDVVPRQIAVNVADDVTATGLVDECIWIWRFLRENREKGVLYAILGFLVGVMVLLSILTVRLCVSGRHLDNAADRCAITSSTTTTTTATKAVATADEPASPTNGLTNVVMRTGPDRDEVPSGTHRSASTTSPSDPTCYSRLATTDGQQYNNHYRTDVTYRPDTVERGRRFPLRPIYQFDEDC